jgi:mannose-6-phosphate isomerase-like protein (cupin superfamily)
MQLTSILAILLLASQAAAPKPPQRRPVGNATLAIMVSDPAGAPLGDVKVTLDGPATREVRTERGRIALENLPFGTYRLRFDREGFLSFEREVVARTGTPIDVKVTLTPAPEPPPPVAPVPPPAAATPAAEPLSTTPVFVDMPTFIEKNYVGRGSGKTTPLACSAGGPATLIQVKDPIVEHAHPDADEFLYAISGQGSVRAAGVDHPLSPGMFAMVPRTVPHIIVAINRGPLVLLSVKAGASCGAP